MPPIYDCSVEAELLTGMRLARAAIGRGDLVVIPTDTVYGVATDAFSPSGVEKLVAAKGRTLASPPPVLIPGIPTMDALAEVVPDEVRALVAKYWPGGLTVILRARTTLDWNLGETKGTVALRMPSHPIALELLSETGPLAVSSANITGKPAATTAEEAAEMLGDSIALYLDGGPGGTVASTIVDATALDRPDGRLRIVREGAIPSSDIRSIVGEDRCE